MFLASGSKGDCIGGSLRNGKRRTVVECRKGARTALALLVQNRQPTLCSGKPCGFIKRTSKTPKRELDPDRWQVGGGVVAKIRGKNEEPQPGFDQQPTKRVRLGETQRVQRA